MTSRSSANTKQILTTGSLLLCICLPGSLAWTQEPTQLLWGNTHLHSSYSVDAYMAVNRSLDPDAGYRYAKGEPVVNPYNRTRVQILEHLDFLAVSRHAEYLGVIPVVMSGNAGQPEAGLFDMPQAAVPPTSGSVQPGDPTITTWTGYRSSRAGRMLQARPALSIEL